MRCARGYRSFGYYRSGDNCVVRIQFYGVRVVCVCVCCGGLFKFLVKYFQTNLKRSIRLALFGTDILQIRDYNILASRFLCRFRSVLFGRTLIF